MPQTKVGVLQTRDNMKSKTLLTWVIAVTTIFATVTAFRWRLIDNYGHSWRDTEHHKLGDVVFTGGFDTEEQDHGRPVRLIAAALGVKSEVFRQAFSSVKPAQGMLGPSSSQARDNKKVLMDALRPYGITNERLDEVSNYYRYTPGRGNLWRHTPARAIAIIENGKVTGFNVIDAGHGYLSEPTVTVTGYEGINVKATLRFSKDFTNNGSIKSLTLIDGPGDEPVVN